MSLFSLSTEREIQRFEQLRAAMGDEQLVWPGRLLERAARKCPNTIALIYKETRVTYQQLHNRVCAFSRVLRDKGIKPGDHVLICFENSIEFYIAYYAVWYCGAVVAPLNTFLHAKEVAHIVQDAQPALIIASKQLMPMFADAGITSLPLMLSEDDMSVEGELVQEIIDIPLDDMAALLYTSGTTGLPKGVMLSGKNIMTNVLQAAARAPFEGELIFGVLPLFHSFAQNVCLWMSVFLCGTVIVVPRIDRRNILDGLKLKPTIFLGVPALYGLLCLLRAHPLDQVKLFVCGGDALPDKIRMGFALLYGRTICNGYGMTESSPLISVDLEGIYGPTSNVGKPVYGCQVSIRDDNKNPVADGDVGNLWVKGDHVMLGYHNAPEATAKAVEDGWLDTGDLAYLDEWGNIVLAGRLKDLIIHKGINIYPQEIENVIISHPNVLRVGVIGQEHEASGEVPLAYVQLRSEQENAAEELKRLCSEHLAAYKVPRTFICSTEVLPATATGKVDKKVLRERLVGTQE